MRKVLFIVVVVCLVALARAQEARPAATTSRAAQKAFARALKLFDRRKMLEALEQFREAAQLAPENSEYAIARETVRQ